MRKLVRRWIPHDLSEANRRERVLKTKLLLEELRPDERNEFANTMTGDESWFFLSYESDSMFARTRDEVIPRTSQKIGNEKVMMATFSVI
jgi:chemotaxis methyl-accepting protein methylase